MVPPEVSVESIARLSDPNRGRIVAVSLSPDARSYRLFTGMGGRSTGSKNRYYQPVEDLNGYGTCIKTAVLDPSIQVGDPSATLYDAQRAWDGWHVASNGEQTIGIALALALDVPFDQVQRQYKNEGPKNDYTARITGAINPDYAYGYMGQIIRRPENHAESVYRTHLFWINPDIELELDQGYFLEPGHGLLTATYDGRGGTDPNYDHPWEVLLLGSLEENMDRLWNAWDPNTRANLVGKEIERESGRYIYAFRSIHPDKQ